MKKIHLYSFTVAMFWHNLEIFQKNDNAMDNNNKIKTHLRAQFSKIGELKITAR